MAKQYMYSETFHSIQGEGHYTGVPSLWLRFFLCNLQCDGFGQRDPTDPDSWELPYQELDLDAHWSTGEKKYNKMSDLPVFQQGCDSSYSWSKKFKGLQHKGTVEDIFESLVGCAMNDVENDEDLKFLIENNHMCFTGGEPLMKHAQEASVGLIDYILDEKGLLFPSVTYETNGTQTLTEDFYKKWELHQKRGTELFFSISPKLWSVSGEKADKALPIHPVQDYYNLSSNGQLKFVVNSTNQAWDEMEDAIERFRAAGVDYPIWVMNCGATLEGQQGWVEGHNPEKDVCIEAIKRGYNYSSRVHVHIFGNQIGT